MEENSEPEEGEASSYKVDNENIDPDIDLSYIDERIKNVLGHFQKDFEGGVSAENLGAKFGGYGSFLPTYERFPSIQPHSKTSQGNYGTGRHPNRSPVEGASQNSNATSNAPPSQRPENASCSVYPLHHYGLPSGNFAVKLDSSLSPSQVAGKVIPRDESLSRSVIPTDHKRLKIRIKRVCDDKTPKVAAICSGLGLDGSPSSSLGNSCEEIGGKQIISQETTTESPTSILQVMTSFPVPDGILISPLHDSLLCLLRKEKNNSFRDSKPVPSLDCSQEQPVRLSEEPIPGNGKLFCQKRTKLNGKSEKLAGSTRGNGVNFINGKTLVVKKSENDKAGVKGILSNKLKCTVPPISTNVADCVKSTARENEVSLEANKDEIRDSLFCSNFEKADSLESISGTESSKSKKWNGQSSLVEKGWEQSVVNFPKNLSFGPGENGMSKVNKTKGNGVNFINGKTLVLKKSENYKEGGKEILSNELKSMAPPILMNVVDSVEATARVLEASIEANKDGIRSRLVCSDVAKEDSLESISGTESSKSKSQKRNGQRSSVEKVREQSVVNFHKNVLLDLGENGRSKNNKPSAPQKCKRDQNKKVSLKAKFHLQNEINMPFEKDKSMFDRKEKSKGNQTARKGAFSMKESLRFDVGAGPEDTSSTGDGVSAGKSKKHKLKLQTSINKVRDNQRYSLDTNLEGGHDNHRGPSGRPFGYGLNDSGLADFETEESAYLNRSKEIFDGTKVDNLLPGSSANGATGVIPHVTENAAANRAPPAVAPEVIKENWVCCDSCQKWRLLPFGTMPEQLPEKWLCSMLNWLPGMNSCDISEEETTRALNALYQIPVAESQNTMQNYANGSMPLVDSVHLQHLSRNQGFSSQTESIRGKKKCGSREVPKADVSSGLIQMSNPKKDQLQESVKRKSLNNITQLPVESNIMKKDSFQRKEKHRVGGEAKRIKLKNKREADHYVHKSSKKSKTGDLYSATNHGNSDGDLGRVCLNSSDGLLAQQSGQSTQKYNKCSNSEHMKERSVFSIKKPAEQTQTSSGGGSLGMRMDVKTGNSVRKRKMKDWQENQNEGELYVKEESSESGFRKDKKALVLKSELKQSHRSDINNISNRLAGDNWVGGKKEAKGTDTALHIQKSGIKNASLQALDGLDSLRKDSVSAQVPMAVTSSSSKASSSHKTRANFEETKASPGESISSSPLRASYPEKFTSRGNDSCWKSDAPKGSISRRGNLKRCCVGESIDELGQSGMERKERVFSNPSFQSHKISMLICQDTDDNHRRGVKTKASSGYANGFLLGNAAHTGDLGQSCSDQHAAEYSHDENMVSKNDHKNAFFPQKPCKGSASQSKDNDSSASDKKVSDPVNGQENLNCGKSMKYGPEIVRKPVARIHETESEHRCNFADYSTIKATKDKKNDYVGRRDTLGQSSSITRMKNQSKQKEHDELDTKSIALCSSNRKSAAQQNVIQDIGCESKVIQVESRSISDYGVQIKRVTEGGQALQEVQQEVCFHGIPGNGDVSKALKQPANAGIISKTVANAEQHMPDLHLVGDLNSPNLQGMNSSSKEATYALNEAKNLRDYADRLKSSGFVFESNEASFQAAVKFLSGASLLETCYNESGKHGDKNHMQAYSTAAKLCETCAQEYERRKEMAAAALAYKCMEVAYMRIVYCKYSSTNRDQNELQAALQMAPQGESPSSSASDVDNLNNQATVDKAILSKSVVSHVPESRVIVARNRPIFARLLDFTQDVGFAMEASRKSQNAFAAANITLEEAQSRECINSARKVIDFSFQDVEELIRLVQLAMEAISRSGLSGVRDVMPL